MPTPCGSTQWRKLLNPNLSTTRPQFQQTPDYNTLSTSQARQCMHACPIYLKDLACEHVGRCPGHKRVTYCGDMRCLRITEHHSSRTPSLPSAPSLSLCPRRCRYPPQSTRSERLDNCAWRPIIVHYPTDLFRPLQAGRHTYQIVGRRAGFDLMPKSSLASMADRYWATSYRNGSESTWIGMLTTHTPTWS